MLRAKLSLQEITAKAPGAEVPLWYLSLPYSTKLLFPSMKKSKLCDLQGTSAISPNEEGTQEMGPISRKTFTRHQKTQCDQQSLPIFFLEGFHLFIFNLLN